VLWAVASEADRDLLLRALPQVHVQRLSDAAAIVGVGADGVRALLERFRDAGVGRVVLQVAHRDYDRFLRELRDEAVEPVSTGAEAGRVSESRGGRAGPAP
jgi:hypothetical protein